MDELYGQTLNDLEPPCSGKRVNQSMSKYQMTIKHQKETDFETTANNIILLLTRSSQTRPFY